MQVLRLDNPSTGFDLNDGVSYQAIWEGPDTGAPVDNGWLAVHQGEPVPTASSLRPKLLSYTIKIVAPPASFQEAVAALKRNLRPRPSDPERKLYHRAEDSDPLVFELCVPRQLVARDSTETTWTAEFECRPYSFTDRLFQLTEIVDARFQRLTNPAFDQASGAPDAPTITGWTKTGTVSIDNDQLFGRYCLKVTAGSSVAQAVTVTLGASYVLSAYLADDASAGTAALTLSASAGTPGTLTATGAPITVNGRTWQRYYRTYAAPAGTGTQSVTVTFGVSTATGYVDGAQLEDGNTPRNFQWEDGQKSHEYRIVTPGGITRIQPRVRITPLVDAHGRQLYRIGPLKIANLNNRAIVDSIPFEFTGANTASTGEVATGRLLSTGYDLELRDARTGRNVWRYIDATTAVDWTVWSEPIHLGPREEREYYLIYGDTTARNPERFNAPEELDVYFSRHDGSFAADVKVWYKVEAARGKLRTLATAAVSAPTGKAGRARLVDWNEITAAGRYNVYRAITRGATSTEPANAKFRLVAVRHGSRTTSYVDRGPAPSRNAATPTITGTNPDSPYSDHRPQWNLVSSSRLYREYNAFIDPDRPGRPGTWDRERNTRANRGHLWATATGIRNTRDERSLGPADEWRLRGLYDIERVVVNVDVQQNPRYYRTLIEGTVPGKGRKTLLKTGVQLEEPEVEADARSAVSTLAAMVYLIEVTAVDAAGEETNARRPLESVRVTKRNGQKIRVQVPEAIPGAVSYNVYCSSAWNPTLKANVAPASIVGTWYEITSAGTGAQTAPTQNNTSTAYPTITDLATLDTGVLAEKVRAVSVLLAEQRDAELVGKRVQRYEIGVTDPIGVYFDAADVPTVDTATAAARASLAHLEYEKRNETTGQQFRVDLIEGTANTTWEVDCFEKALTEDERGNPQLDALHVQHGAAQWLELSPGVPNIIRNTTIWTGAAGAERSIRDETLYRERH